MKSKNIYNFKSYIAPNYKNKFYDHKLIKIIKSYKPRYIIINIGGGSQEPLAVNLKNNLNYQVSIMCTGAAIAFLTGEQAPINKFIDKIYLGWFTRIMWNPRLYLGRILKKSPNKFKLRILTLYKTYRIFNSRNSFGCIIRNFYTKLFFKCHN